MKTVSVREMKANWAEYREPSRQRAGFEVLNRGKPTVRIIPAQARKVLKWDDHLATAVSATGRTGAETLQADRESRW